MKLRGKFTITEYENDESQSFRVTGTKADGTRVRQNFKTEAEALGRKQELEIEAANVQVDHRVVTTRLRPDQLAEAELAYTEMKGKPILPAIRWFLANYREPDREITLKKALADFIAERTQANDRPLTIRNLKQRIGTIVDHQPEKPVSSVTEPELKDAIFKPGRGPVGQDNERRALLQFFNWATEKGYCGANPMAGIAPIRIERDAPQVLPLEKARALLTEAAAYKDGVVLPYVALALLAGIRPTELSRISWSDIKLDRGVVIVGAKAAKLRGRRVVEMAQLTQKDKAGNEVKLTPNLCDWLLSHATKKTPIVGKNWRKDLDRVKELAGLVKRETAKSEKRVSKKKKGRIVQARRYWRRLTPIHWAPDILRHTAISYHFAMFKHEGQTAQWAGNSPDMIHRHYKGLVEPAEAAEFWDIRPATVGQITNLPAGAVEDGKVAKIPAAAGQ